MLEHFNICVYSDNKETIVGVIDILSDATTFFKYIKPGKTVEASFYNIEKIEQIEEIYSLKNNIIHLKDFEAFNSQDTKYKSTLLHNLEEKIIENSHDFLTIISAKNKDNNKTCIKYKRRKRKKIIKNNR